MKILVLSCDKNADIFEAFHHCMEKYYPNHPKVVYSTETVVNPYYKTICKDYPLNQWSKRIRETLNEIEDEQILLMVDDCFIRQPVDVQRIDYICEQLKDNIAFFNFEKSFDTNDEKCEIDSFKKRQKGAKYSIYIMCGLWDKNKLIKILSEDMTPWEVKYTQNTYDFDYYINSEDFIIDWGYHYTGVWFGLCKGQWCKEAVDFLTKEGLKIDFNKRVFLKRLSIITPYYKTLEATLNLAKVLEPQLNEEVEWIIVDDGCNEKELDKIKANVIHLSQNSGGASIPRNVGLDNAKGQYIAFIDSDDSITNDYIKEILNKIHTEYFDYCMFSWDSQKLGTIIIDENHQLQDWNCCVWNCIYNKNIINKIRFNQDLIIAEDHEFNKKVRHGKCIYIHKILYHYSHNDNGLTHTYKYPKNKVKEEDMILVEALPIYKEKRIYDVELKRIPRVGEIWKVTPDRLSILLCRNSFGVPLVKVLK